MNILINGGSKGIGREVALHLALDPANKIIITGREMAALETVAGNSANIFALETDLSDRERLALHYRDQVTSHFKSVDIMINMAGFLVSAAFMEIDDNDARKMMEINFFGTAAAIRLVRPLMSEGSHIINISSMGGYQGSPKYRGMAYYSASKAAVACLSECLAEEFRESKIYVNCIALGAVQTEMLQEAFPGYRAPVGADKIAPFISYFALNAHRFMNGKIIPLALSNP
jgi:3-oxoacyl-[acyl-carrier protein] reductase